MGITSVNEQWKEGLTLEENIEGGSATRVWLVEFDDRDPPNWRPLTARYAPGVPRLLDLHPRSPRLYVQDVKVKIHNGPLLFKVAVTYKTGPTDLQIPGGTTNPLDEPAVISWGFSTSNEQIDRDIKDQPILNSSDESFDPPITKDIDDLILRIEHNEATFDPPTAHDYKGAVNQDSFWGFAPGLVKCINFSARSARSGEVIYWQVTYEFQVRWDGWKRRILDQGFRTKTGVDSSNKPTYKVIKDDDDTPLSQPELLDGAGNKLANGANAVFLEFDIHPSLSFSSLPIA